MFLLIDVYALVQWIGILLIPAAIALRRRSFARALLFGLVLALIATVFAGCVSDWATDAKLAWLGFDHSGLIYDDQLRFVAPENIDQAYEILNARIVGAGWGFKTLMSFIVIVIPYTFASVAAVHLVQGVLDRRRDRRST